MGGAVGHIMHLYDNHDLTFGEIVSILNSAASGRLEEVSEKLDGLNLVFSWDVSEGQLRVARAAGDIKRSGLDAESLASKFAGRGNLYKAFTQAFKILSGAINSLPEKVKLDAFGMNTNRWYSMEVIYTKNPNVINYDSNNIVFHGWPTFTVDDTGKVSVSSDDNDGVGLLSRYIERMQSTVEMKGWKINGPAMVRFKKLSDGSILKNAVSRISDAMTSAGLNASSTVGDYVESLLAVDIRDLRLPNNVSKMMLKRCMKEPGSPTLIDIRNASDPADHVAITDFVKGSPERLKGYVRPIESAINDFAVELLKGLESTLIDDTGKEVQRIRKEVSSAVSAIQSSSDETAIDMLNKQMEKLKSIENITSPVEGVVFIYKGNAYKFTGSFASANQILGLFKYGQRGSKK